MPRPFVIRRLTKVGGPFASGKHAISICQRSGFKFPYKEMVLEPGTNTWVHRSEDDGDWDLVTHAQNFPPDKLTERISLRWAHPEQDGNFGVLSTVSADQIWFLSVTSISTFVCIGTGTSVSTGAGISAGTPSGLNFNLPQNSQYYIITFQGI